MAGVHKWDEMRSSSVRLNFRLRKQRQQLSPSKRKSKARVYNTRWQCSYPGCIKEVLRLRNHLRQTHRIKDGEAIDEYVKISERVPETRVHGENSASSEESEFSSSDFEVEERLITETAYERMRNSETFGAIDSDSDEDWLAREFNDQHGTNCAFEDRDTGKILECHYDNDKIKENKFRTNVEEIPKFHDNENYDNELSNIEDDDDYDNEDLEEKFYLSSKEEDDLLHEFVQWQKSIDGGNRAERQAQKHKRIVMSIVRHNDDTEINYEYLSCPSFLNSWMTKLKDENKDPSTIKTYLNSVKHFIDFIVASEKELFKNQNLEKVRVLLRQWRNTLYKEIQELDYEKQLNARDFFPTPSEIEIFDKSEISISAMTTLKQAAAAPNFQVTKTNFCLVRDYILTSLIFDNASRPGALSNMTLHEYSKVVFKDGGYVISVKKHKTKHKGPAHIALSTKNFKWLNTYLNKFRNQLDGIDTNPKHTVFVSWNGGPMDSSLITTQMGTFWKRALGKSSAKINPTLVRKFTTTTVHENVPSMKQKTANLLCHSLGMAEKKYALYDKQQAAVGTSAALKQVQRRNFSDCATFSDVPLDEIFRNEIRQKSIKKADVEEKIFTENEYFKNFKIDDKFIKKVKDSVRYIIAKSSKNEDAQPIKVAHENQDSPVDDEVASADTDDVQTSGHSKVLVRTRKAFSSSELELIYKHLGHYIYSNDTLSKSEFSEYVSQVKELEELVKKFGVNSLLVKMRTERKNR